MVILDKKGGGRGGLGWYRKRWIMIFQYPIIALLAAIATDITQATGIYCPYESKPYFAKLWITIVSKLSLAIAVTSVFRFYMQLKNQLASHRPLAKLFAFKVVVFLTFVQSIVFMILNATNSLNPTPTMTYADINMGVPAMLICLETVPLSILFVWAYSCTPYMIRSATTVDEAGNLLRQPKHTGELLGIRAWLSMWNPMETLRAIAFGFKLGSEEEPHERARGEYYAMEGY